LSPVYGVPSWGGSGPGWVGGLWYTGGGWH
jgi:hypothetical protein